MAISYTPTIGSIVNTNGVISSGDCHVTQSSGMDIQISTGEAYIFGTFSHTGSPEILTVANNNSGSIRYDLVVIHVDLVAETAQYQIKTGNLNPQQDETVWELPLAGIGVPNNAMSISNANIQDLRVISDDSTPKNICTLTKSTDTTIASGAEITLAWDAPNQANDPYRFYTFNNYIQPRVMAWYNVQSQIRWAPASTASKPVIFKVNMVDPTTFRKTEIYNVASVQTAAGDVNFTFNQNMLIPQLYYLYMSVQNTTDVNITVKSVASVSPFFRLQFTTYPLPS